MRVLLIHRYFWPDTPPYASMLFDIAKQLVTDGYEVEVLTTQPSYKSDSTLSSVKAFEFVDGVKIKRIRLLKENGRSVLYRILNMIYFPLAIVFHMLLNRSIDVVMASTAPPVVAGFSSALGAKIIKAKFVYHCMDLHPEIGRISGEFKYPTLFKLLLKIDQWSCRTAERVVVLSEDMRNSLLQRPNSTGVCPEIINNFYLSTFMQTEKIAAHDKYKKDKGVFRVLFAGNVGRFQMLEAFVDAMYLLENIPDIELVFLGEGSALDRLKSRAKDKLNKQIKFFPHQNILVARKIISEADLGVISLMTDVYRYAFPSKTMTYLVEGCPLLVAVEPESEIVEFVSKNDIGVTAFPGNPESIARAIRSVFLTPEYANKMSRRCVQVAEEQFSRSVIVDKWSKVYKEMSGSMCV